MFDQMGAAVQSENIPSIWPWFMFICTYSILLYYLQGIFLYVTETSRFV